MNELDATAIHNFLAKIVSGKVPDAVIGGEHDGLRYFPLVMDGKDYWLTDYGLMDPECLEGLPGE